MKTYLRGLVLAMWPCLIQAAPSPCPAFPPAASALWLAAEVGQGKAFDSEPGTEVSVERRRFGYRANRSPEQIGITYRHEYSIVDIDALPLPRPVPPAPGTTDVDPSSNGHLHTLALGLDLSPLLDAPWRLRLQPTLSISSNLLKDPSDIRDDALQLAFALQRSFASTTNGQWLASLCGDHRFGDYRLYPSLSWQWAHPGWQIHLGYPDTHIRSRLRETLHTGLRLMPAGNRWRVHDADTGDSFFNHRAWQAEWYLDWQWARHWTAELSLGQLVNNRYRFTLETGERFRGKTDDPLQVRLRLVWRAP